MDLILRMSLLVVAASAAAIHESDNAILAGMSRAADEDISDEAIRKEVTEFEHEIEQGECSEESPEHCCPHCHLCPLCSRCNANGMLYLDFCEFCSLCPLCKDHCASPATIRENDAIEAQMSRAAIDEDISDEAINKEGTELAHEIEQGECSEESPEHCCPHCHLCPLCSRCDGSTNDLESCKFCGWCHLCKDHC